MNCSYQVVYWRDIPAQVKVKHGRQKAGKALSKRFQEAIDRCAMKVGATGNDDYLAAWRSSEWLPAEGGLADALEMAARRLEREYTENRLKEVVDNGGWEAGEGS